MNIKTSHLGIGSLLATALLLGPACSAEIGAGENEFELGDAVAKKEPKGKELFRHEDFGGNGRTCETCHTRESGTINPAQVEALYQEDPNGPLFQHDAADTLGGGTFDRVREHATVIVEIELPDNVAIAGSSARSVALNRGTPTTNNTPSMESIFQADGRFTSLQQQAQEAIKGHAQSEDVTAEELDAIAEFEQTLFNRDNVKQFVKHGAALSMPAGNTESEKRGRRFFIDDAASSMDMVGEGFQPCGWCHSGNGTNELSGFFVANISPAPLPEGFRFFTVLVSEFNSMGNPTYDFEFTNPDGSVTTVTSPDPGLSLITGVADHSGFFKNQSVWGAADTAPYFHDNSAKDLEELMDHYQQALFALSDGVINLTEQDKVDIAAYVRLL